MGFTSISIISADILWLILIKLPRIETSQLSVQQGLLHGKCWLRPQVMSSHIPAVFISWNSFTVNFESFLGTSAIKQKGAYFF